MFYWILNSYNNCNNFYKLQLYAGDGIGLGNCVWSKEISGCQQWRRNEFESERGHMSCAKYRKKICRDPPLFDSISTIIVFVSAFVRVSTVWSVSCLLFFYSRCTVVKVGNTCPRAIYELWSRRHWLRVSDAQIDKMRESWMTVMALERFPDRVHWRAVLVVQLDQWTSPHIITETCRRRCCHHAARYDQQHQQRLRNPVYQSSHHLLRPTIHCFQFSRSRLQTPKRAVLPIQYDIQESLYCTYT